MGTDEDDLLVRAAADIAADHDVGRPVPQSVLAMLRAIAATRDEARRHDLARQAEARAGAIAEAARMLLRTAIFALA